MSLFVTFEGPEGCGKSTQMRLLARHLTGCGYNVLATREPGGTSIGDQIRRILLNSANADMQPTSEFLLFSAARAQHVRQVILPHLERGGIVLCDRFADSSLAYQGYGHQLELGVLKIITGFATDNLVPDLTLYLDVPVQVGLGRKAGGSGDSWNRMEQQTLAYHERVRSGYLQMAESEPNRWVVIDATHSIQQVQSQVRESVLSRLERKQGEEKT